MLVILYGRFQKHKNLKQQRMIDGGSTCMYRELASKYGEIIYLAPQDVCGEYDRVITDDTELFHYLDDLPSDVIVWSVKCDEYKDIVLRLLINKKRLIYYSCCSNNMYNDNCDHSLVDLPERVKKNALLWVKGKDPEYWLPSKNKVYDFLLVNPRGDKNEEFFLREMQRSKKEYSILWIGGEKFKDRVRSKHEITYTPFLSKNEVRKHIPICKVGVILSEHPAEGFPQVFLEMTMCGVPVVYLYRGTPNRVYADNFIGIVEKKIVVEVAENVLGKWSVELSNEVRLYAIKNYSLEKCYESILKGVGYAN